MKYIKYGEGATSIEDADSFFYCPATFGFAFDIVNCRHGNDDVK